MALNKKSGFGFDLEDKFKNVGSVGDVSPADADKYTHTHTDTHTEVKETRSKRLYLLAQPSVHRKLDDYAKAHGNTFNNLIHELMEEFIERKGL